MAAEADLHETPLTLVKSSYGGGGAGVKEPNAVPVSGSLVVSSPQRGPDRYRR